MSGFTQVITAGNLPAAASNTASTAGKVGEIVRGDIALGSPISVLNNTAVNLTSVSLTAGNWMLFATVGFLPAATTNVTQTLAALALTTASLTSIDNLSYDYRNYPAFVPTATTMTGHIAGVLQSLSATTSIFFNLRAQFTVSTMQAYGSLVAVRFA